MSNKQESSIDGKVTMLTEPSSLGQSSHVLRIRWCSAANGCVADQCDSTSDRSHPAGPLFCHTSGGSSFTSPHFLQPLRPQFSACGFRSQKERKIRKCFSLSVAPYQKLMAQDFLFFLNLTLTCKVSISVHRMLVCPQRKPQKRVQNV